MKDVVLAGKTTDIEPVIQEMMPAPDPFAAMIIEHIPNRWLNKNECEKSICFESFKMIRFNQWQMGRIFDSVGEMRWKNNEKSFDVVYTGPNQNISNLKPINTEDWERSKPVRYLLWGKRFTDDKLKIKNPTYMEIQIPRLLVYPFNVMNKKRASIRVIEYRKKDTGQVIHYRFSTWRKST